MDNKIYLGSLVVSLLALSASGQAADVRIAAEVMYFDYEETDTRGRTLNQETGFIPGLTLAASSPYRRTFNTLEFSVYDGEVDYDGQTQSGQPHQTTTEQNILRILYRLSWSPDNSKSGLYGKVYWQQWDRDIQPNNNVLGLFERYRWWTLEGGVQVPFIKDQRRNLLFELGALVTTSGTILIDLADLGYGKPTLDLGDDYGFSAKLKYELQHTRNSSFQFGVQIRRWEFGRSNSETLFNGSTLITITEPDSETTHSILSAGYRYHF